MTAPKPPPRPPASRVVVDRPRDRDVATTGFSPHLDKLLRDVPEALCTVFLDAEGETVDMATRIDLFDSRIYAAETAIMMAGARRASAKLGQGSTLELRLESTRRSMITRMVSEGCDLMLIVGTPTLSARAAELVATTAAALQIEAKLPPPPSCAVLRAVEKKQSATGLMVPAAIDDSGVRRRVTALLGHRHEDGQTRFLVRLENGEELVIVHEEPSGRWTRG